MAAAAKAAKGNAALLRFKAQLRAMPRTIAHSVAHRAAPKLTDNTQGAFDSGRTVYGESRPVGASGPLTLVRSGRVRDALKFAATGTQIRCVIGPRYARFLIGRYKILPNGGLPAGWQRDLSELVRTTEMPR